MAAPHNAAIQRQAQIAQAQANQASAEAQQQSQRAQAEYARQTSIVQAQYKAEVDKAQSEAAQAGPLAQAQATMAVLSAQTELAQRQSDLRQRQLVAEVIRPAEAEAEKVRILALADAKRVTMQAEAAASHNRVALDRMLIEQLPQIVREAAAGLAGANVSVLNGAEGLSEIAAGLVAQGLTILESVKKGMAGATDERPEEGKAEDDQAEEAPPAAGRTGSSSAGNSRTIRIMALANSVVLRGCRSTAGLLHSWAG